MSEYRLTEKQIEDYGKYLFTEERSQSTVEKYLHDSRSFKQWLQGRSVTKELVTDWKNYLQETGYAPVTINARISAINGLFRFLGWEECKIKFLKIQRRLFRNPGRELTKEEYQRLLGCADGTKDERIVLLMETICATGIRVSEVKYITWEAIMCGKTEVALKGKIRTILLPGRLCRKLIKYARKNKIASGELFLTKSGKGLSRKQIWAEMKTLCAKAGVEASKVFPHNLRHLFARTFYKVCRDVTKLADVLGHSSIETTRIYLISTGEEHARTLERMHLVS